MSNPLDWLTPEGMEAHINRVWLEHFGFPPPVPRKGRDPQRRVTPGDGSGTEVTPAEAPCGEFTMEFTWHQGTAAGGAQRLRIEFQAEGSSEIVVKFGLVEAARG